MINRIMSDSINRIYIYGATELGKEVADNISGIIGSKELVFIDRNEEFQMSGFNGRKVVDISTVTDIDSLYIIAGTLAWQQMYDILLVKGISDKNIIFPDKIERKRIEKFNKAIIGRIPQPMNKVALNIPLVEHCNLNCQMCHHFAPIANESFLNVESFEKDISRVYDILGDDFYHINLTGGEPTLHPRLMDFIKLTRKYFKKSTVWILTNGLLLNDFPDDFWNCCRENDITIEATKYPLNFDYDLLEEKAKKFGVKYFYYNTDPIKTSIHFFYDVEGKQNPYKMYNACYFNDGHGRYLKNGKLWHCTVTPNFEHFNKFFKTNIPITDRDYLGKH